MSVIKETIEALAKGNEETYSLVAVVEAIDSDKRTCDVSFVNGDADLFDVRLQSSVSGNSGVVFFPKKGSEVVVSFLNKDLGVITKTSIIDLIEVVIGDTKVLVNDADINLTSDSIVIESSEIDVTTNNIATTATGTSSLEAVNADIEAVAIGLTGAVTITGAATISGAVAMSAGVTMGTGSNGGIPKGGAMAEEINKLITEVNKIRTALTTWVPIPNDGGAALKSLTADLSELTNVDEADITNENAKH